MIEHMEVMLWIWMTSNTETESFFQKRRPQGQYQWYCDTTTVGGNNYRGRGRYHP